MGISRGFRRVAVKAIAGLGIVMLIPAMGVSQVGAAGDTSNELKMLKVDPPNWWVGMAAPMLLVRGEGLRGAAFSLSDKSLRIGKTVVSENGHWAQVWLTASPAKPETVKLRAGRGGKTVEIAYTFAARRPAADGFAGFSSRDVMYLIMTDRFADGDLTNDGPEGKSAASSAEAAAERAKPRGWHGGDLRGIGQHLDYLKALGVTTVWTTPVYENHEAQSYHGYGATDMYRVDEHYGTLDDVKALAAGLHARGMKFVLDTVPNHIGPGNPWVQDEPAPDWFHGTAEHHRDGETNFQALIDPHAPERDRVGTMQGWFAGVLPDMNTDSPAVAAYLRQDVVWWIEQSGADGLRIDTFPYVNREFWRDLHAELGKLYPRLTEVGEVFNGDPVITSSFAGGVTRSGTDTGLYTPFDFPTYFALRDVFAKGAPLSRLSDVLARDSLYSHAERLVTFLGNHDTTRLRQEVKSNAEMRMAFAYLMTTRGMPQLYAGDEIAMRGGDDPDNRRDFPGGFGHDASGAFSAGGRGPEQQGMYDWVARLAEVRRAHPALGCGSEQVLKSGADVLVYLRTGKGCEAAGAGSSGTLDERVLVAIHRGNKAETSEIELEGTGMAGCRLRRAEVGDAGSAVFQGSKLQLQMGADDVLIAACE